MRMKLAAAPLLGMALLSPLAASGGTPPVQGPGAFVPVSPTSPQVVRAAEFAVAAQQKVIRAATGEASARLGLVRIDAAEQQVVSGIRYRLRLTVTLDDRRKGAQADGWWQAWRTPDPYRLTAWTWP
jgi:hypothetical protein